jgi:hypothetical protein
MAHEEGYVESAEEVYEREFPLGSLKRQEEEQRRELEKLKNAVPPAQWRGPDA